RAQRPRLQLPERRGPDVRHGPGRAGPQDRHARDAPVGPGADEPRPVPARLPGRAGRDDRDARAARARFRVRPAVLRAPAPAPCRGTGACRGLSSSPMANILVIQHGKAQLPGRLGLTLRDHGFRLDVRKVALPPEQGGKPLPPDLDNVHGIVSLGGPQHVDEPHPWMEQEKELIRAAHERQLPVIGICLGQQLIAQALGGEVARMETPEVGFHDLSLTFAGQTETILAGIPWESPQFFSHGYAVTKAPPEAAVLAKTALSPNAVFRVGLRT